LSDDKKGMSLVDLETGLIFEDVKHVVTYKQDDFIQHQRRMSEDNKSFVDEYGNFIFKVDSKKSNKLDEKVSDSDIAKLIYCATYLDYDNILHHDDGKPVSKSDLKDLIGVSERIFYKWYNIMIKSKVLIEKDNKLSMNKNYCIKGKLSKNKEYNRIFINAIRYVYTENRGKSLKSLGGIMRMLPHVNYKHNVLCWNPNEEDEEKVKPIEVGELMKALGYYNNRDSKKFINMMSKFRINDGQPVMLFFNDNAYLTENYVIFNPLLTYSGKNEDLPEIYKMFVLLANKQKSKNKGQNQLNQSDTKGLSVPKKVK